MGRAYHPLRLTASPTAPGETITLAMMTVISPTRISWGDGTSQILTANSTAAVTHVYASAGTYPILVENARKITKIQLDSAKLGGMNTSDLRYSQITYFYVTLITGSAVNSRDMSAWRPTTFYLSSMGANYLGTFNSADVSAWRPTTFYLYSMGANYLGTFNSADVSAWRPTYFYMYSMGANYLGTFNSADVSAWRPTYFYMHSMGANYLGTFNSADVSAWRPTYFRLYSMGANYLGTFNSADVSAWRPTYFYLSSMGANYLGTFNSADVSAWRPTYFYMHSMGASYVCTFTASCMRSWTALATLTINDLGLNAATIDTILEDLYAGRMGFTAAAPVATMGGNNGDPNGVYQAANPPTTGQEYKHVLVNDDNGEGFKKWAITT
jgi:hypothetical protein